MRRRVGRARRERARGRPRCAGRFRGGRRRRQAGTLGGGRPRLTGDTGCRRACRCGPRRYASAWPGTRRVWNSSLDNLSGAPATLQVGAALVGAERGALVPGSGSREESVSLHGARLGHRARRGRRHAGGGVVALHRLRRHAVRCGGPHRRRGADELRGRAAPDGAPGIAAAAGLHAPPDAGLRRQRRHRHLDAEGADPPPGRGTIGAGRAGERGEPDGGTRAGQVGRPSCSRCRRRPGHCRTGSFRWGRES